jgi:hypothetical protein
MGGGCKRSGCVFIQNLGLYTLEKAIHFSLATFNSQLNVTYMHIMLPLGYLIITTFTKT